MPEISKKLTQQFADCLEATMNAEQAVDPPAAGDLPAETEPSAGGEQAPAAAPATSPSARPVAVAKPVGGIGLGLAAIWSIIKDFFRRLLGGGKTST